MESLFEQLLHWLRLAIEVAAAFWIAIGFAYAFVELVAVRTGLNYFLSKEIRETREDGVRETGVVARLDAMIPGAAHPAQA